MRRGRNWSNGCWVWGTWPTEVGKPVRASGWSLRALLAGGSRYRFPLRNVRGANVMKIAVMPGDGVGKEVIPQGLRVLSAAAKKFGFTYPTTDYPFGAEHYLETGITLPDSALKELGAHDAILFGAVGADP